MEVAARVPAELQDFENLRAAWRGFSRDPVFFSYVRCPQCGLLYCREYFSDAQLKELYSEMPDNTDGVGTETLQRTHDGYARAILRVKPQPQRVLELGSDIGLTSARIQRLGGPSAMTAVEPNRAVHEELRRRVPGITVTDDLVMAARSAPFDLVVAIHVVDHLVDMQATLAEVARLTDPDALIAVVVHNEASVVRRGLRRRWPPFCLQHPQLFNPRTLRDALASHGWSRVAVHRTVNHFPLRHLGESVASVAPVPHRLAAALPAMDVALPLGNILAVAHA